MGIDKLGLVTAQFPNSHFIEAINADLRMPREERMFDVSFKSMQEFMLDRRTTNPISVKTRKHVKPEFFLQLNFWAPGARKPVHRFECNPNKLPEGMLTLHDMLKRMFGSTSILMKVSRIDLNADIELPVDFFLRTLRVPRKRRSSRHTVEELPVVDYRNRGVTGFYIGRSPALLRVYDKREDMRRLKEDVARIPQIYTRIEWEYRHRKCPVNYCGELSQLLEYRPFDALQILEVDEVYDFHNETRDSLKRLTYKALVDDYGAQEAARILNSQRNFARDYRFRIVDRADIKNQLQHSYSQSTRKLFENQAPDSRLSDEFVRDAETSC